MSRGIFRSYSPSSRGICGDTVLGVRRQRHGRGGPCITPPARGALHLWWGCSTCSRRGEPGTQRQPRCHAASVPSRQPGAAELWGQARAQLSGQQRAEQQPSSPPRTYQAQLLAYGSKIALPGQGIKRVCDLSWKRQIQLRAPGCVTAAASWGPAAVQAPGSGGEGAAEPAPALGLPPARQLPAVGCPAPRLPMALALTSRSVCHQLADSALHSRQGLPSCLLGQQPDALEVVEGQQVLGPVALGRGRLDQHGAPAASTCKEAMCHLHGDGQEPWEAA